MYKESTISVVDATCYNDFFFGHFFSTLFVVVGAESLSVTMILPSLQHFAHVAGWVYCRQLK